MQSPNSNAILLHELLNDAEKMVQFTCEVTGLSRGHVAQQLTEENSSLGHTVWKELAIRGITPYRWSTALENFYVETTAFLFESVVWNRSSLKQELRQWITSYLQSNYNRPIRVLVFGDGLGFDSAYFAGAGHDTSYFEVSELAIQFASKVHAACGQQVERLTTIEEVRAQSFDVIVCLDVLEHVEDPAGLVQLLSSILRPDGRFITHALFWYIAPSVGTHLASNRRFSGDWKRLYRPEGLRPIEATLFWNPVVLAKEPATTKLPSKLRILLGGWLLSIGRFWSAPHVFIVKRMLKRSIGPWPEMEKVIETCRQ